MTEIFRSNAMNNKRLGTAFENEFCELLSARGFWVHFMSPSASGAQPCDIIACKDNTPYLFECKTCEDNTFRISRAEENQKLTFEKFFSRNNDNCFFAVKHNDNIYLIRWGNLKVFNKIKLSDNLLLDKWGFMQ